MHWQRLDRDASIKVIDSVKSADNAGMFAIGTSEVQRGRLSFYKDYSAYKVTNYASLPSFTFEYLSDGTFFHYLDGTEDPIHTVNDKGALDLTERNIVDYLTFYYTHVGDESGDVIVINNPNDMPLLDSLDPAAYDAVFSHHNPPEIEEKDGSFTVKTDLYKDSQLVRAEIEVNHKGRVSIKDQKMIVNEMMDSGLAEAIE